MQAKSVLLELMNERKAWLLPEYKLPVRDTLFGRKIREAAECVRVQDTSDPFASSRITLYMQQGYVLPSEVLKDCRTAQGIRAKERQLQNTVQEVLGPVKRKMDEDWAWNQHKAAKYKEAA